MDEKTECLPDVTEFAAHSNEAAFDIVSRLIDTAQDEKSRKATMLAFDLLNQLKQRDLTPEQEVLLHYFMANAWENRVYEEDKKQSWDWEQPLVQEQILELRRAIRHEAFGNLDRIRRCQILTNLANSLSSIGRIIEAIEQWDKVIATEPRFAMAIGNRGYGLQAYSRCFYDLGHSNVFQVAASDSFQEASSEMAYFESENGDAVRKKFSGAHSSIVTAIDIKAIRAKLDATKHSLGRSKAERSYRKWVLENRLFLNPLNDLGEINIASHDVLTLPNITQQIGQKETALPPSIIGLFNQLKQEFVSARYLFFDGVHSDTLHFSDKNVLIYNTLDYPSHSLAVEKTRAAYRLAYSLFDKIAYFLNHYLEVGWPDDKVNFRNLWYEQKGKPPKQILTVFKDRENWPLRGLFWLSKDLFVPEFKEATDPEAEAIAEVRNFLEHKYLQIHENWGIGHLGDDQTGKGLGFHLAIDEFESQTLRVLKLARAALIYLSFSVHREEYIRDAEKPDSLIMPIPLDTWEDEWKI